MHPLQEHRDYFLRCFRDSVAKARESLDQFATELLLELPSLAYPEYCYRLYRADIAGKRDGKSVIHEITSGGRDVAAPPGFFPSSVSFDAPVVWYGIEFVVAGSVDEVRLVEWTKRWLDVTDSRYVESAEFQEVIHNVRPPKKVEGGFEISVDFGTAPVAAFDELVQILSATGNVSVGSFFIAEGKKTKAQPGATDNPDDAQRI
ncbi:hypothetical protein ASA1KI_03610 [Opitutales bacterium ASA1]|uniref:hypothetical protein n=1 Tax=Congregicoccus parvus TaxID=3081749 RepID=UPI002B2A0721|nr:hypothetical protein ASA1KI_03610 [Opitutales bacterium ASA1]